MSIYEGSILEGVSHYEKVKALLQGRTDKEAIEMMAYCIATIAEYNQYEDEEEVWEEEQECEEEETEQNENAPNSIPNDLHKLTNGELYIAIENCQIYKEDSTKFIEEMKNRGFKDFKSFGSNSANDYYGRFETYEQYVAFKAEIS